MVCTRSASGRYNLAPIAWTCPLDYEPVSKILFVCDPGHASYENLCAAGEFALALPDFSQYELCLRAGKISGRETDKFESLGLFSFPARRIDVRIPEGVAGWLECRLIRVIPEGSVAIVLGEVLRASTVEDAWKRRIHYAGDDLAYRPGPAI